MEAVLVKNADRMMTSAGLLDEGIELCFADGRSGLVPFAAIPEIPERAVVTAIELPNPYEMVIETTGDGRVEIPWHFLDTTAMRPTALRWRPSPCREDGRSAAEFASSESQQASPRMRLRARRASGGSRWFGLRTESRHPDSRH